MQGEAGGGRIIAAIVGVVALVVALVVLALILRSEAFAARAAIAARRWMSVLPRLVGKGPVDGWDVAVVKFRTRVLGLVRRRWVGLTVSTLVGHLSL